MRKNKKQEMVKMKIKIKVKGIGQNIDKRTIKKILKDENTLVNWWLALFDLLDKWHEDNKPF